METPTTARAPVEHRIWGTGALLAGTLAIAGVFLFALATLVLAPLAIGLGTVGVLSSQKKQAVIGITLGVLAPLLLLGPSLITALYQL